MTTPVFPQLPGQGWPLVRSPVWKTGIQTTQSGRELRVGFMSYPLYTWSATYDVLRNSSSFPEFQQLIGFFNECSGSLTAFNFQDPDDNTVSTPQLFGVGDGSTVNFQLVRSLGGYVEPVTAPSTVGAITLNGTPTGAYALNYTNGIVTFSSPPGIGVAIAWTGTFYFPCRFLADTYDFSRDMSSYYSMSKLEFQSVKP